MLYIHIYSLISCVYKGKQTVYSMHIWLCLSDNSKTYWHVKNKNPLSMLHIRRKTKNLRVLMISCTKQTKGLHALYRCVFQDPKSRSILQVLSFLALFAPVQHHCCLCLCLSFFSLHLKSCTWKTIQKHPTEMSRWIFWNQWWSNQLI